MAWAKAGSTTLASANSTLSVTGLTTNKFILSIIYDTGRSGSVSTNPVIRFNNDTGSNYARRKSSNGGSDGTSASATNIETYSSGNSEESFIIGYTADIAGEEKLSIINCVFQNTAGAGTYPLRQEVVGKWANTSDRINRIDWITDDSSTWTSDSNISVLGSDGVESMKVQDGAVYYETDTNKSYILSGTTWSEL